jgi:hypothetical protein
MNRYRFEISSNGFILHIRFSGTEEAGLDRCKRYMSDFQKQVANVQMKVRIFEREKKKNIWEYHGAPYLYKRTMIKKPLIIKAEPQK